MCGGVVAAMTKQHVSNLPAAKSALGLEAHRQVALELIGAFSAKNACTEKLCSFLHRPQASDIGAMQVCSATNSRTTVRAVDVPYSHNDRSQRAGTSRNAQFYETELSGKK